MALKLSEFQFTSIFMFSEISLVINSVLAELVHYYMLYVWLFDKLKIY